MRGLIYQAFRVLGKGEVKTLEDLTFDPQLAQQERMRAILGANEETTFGKMHGFKSIKSAHDYRNAVPLSTYEDILPFIDRVAEGEKNVLTKEDPFMFATTSGTTGAQKLIPITKSYMNEFRRASVVSGFNLIKDFPGLSSGVAIPVFSPACEGMTKGGIPYGAISGRLFLEESKLFKTFISPLPYEVCLIKDYDSRYYTILRLALGLPVATLMTLNPSTIVLLARKLAAFAPRLIKDVCEGTITPPQKLPENIQDALKKYLIKDPKRASELSKLVENDRFTPHRIWSNLQVICCWTRAAAAFYLQDFPEFFGDVPISDVTYGASEGRGSVYVGGNRQMLAIRSHFYEFIPEEEIKKENPTVLLAHELEPGQNYHILFTTSGGLYRYHLNDVIKVVGFYNKTPLIEFQYKGGNVSSFTGEKITELQVTKAMTAALESLHSKAKFFTVIPQFRPQPHYEILFEPLAPLPAGDLAASFDHYLGEFNSEYRSKRQSQRLTGVELTIIADGTYEKVRRQLVAGGVPDSQIKISHLNPKPELREMLMPDQVLQR